MHGLAASSAEKGDRIEAGGDGIIMMGT